MADTITGTAIIGTGCGTCTWTVPLVTASTITTTAGVAWTLWNDSITSSTSASIWTNWMLPAGHSDRGRLYAERAQRAVEAQAAQAAEMNEESRRVRAQMHAHNEAATAVKNAARDKARALLAQSLTDRQRIDLASNGYFDLETIQPSGERRRYRIKRGRAGNVHRLDEQGREVRRYCIHPVIACPDEDTMLTQKLWLETNEELFLRTANAS